MEWYISNRKSPKVLTDGGVRLGVVVSDIHGKSGRAMIDALVAGELSDAHRLVLGHLLRYIDYLGGQIAALRQVLLAGLAPQQRLLQALQTVPGLDETAAALLLVEIGDDMGAFGSPERLAS